MSGERTSYIVTKRQTVKKLKEQIRTKTKIPLSRQLLTYRARQLSNNEMLAHCDVQPGSTIYLTHLKNDRFNLISTDTPFEICVKTLTGKTSTMMVTRGQTVEKLKKQVYDEDGIPFESQLLISEGRQMDDSKLLGDYDVWPQCTVYLMKQIRGI